jgi:hypothetical protein
MNFIVYCVIIPNTCIIFNISTLLLVDFGDFPPSLLYFVSNVAEKKSPVVSIFEFKNLSKIWLGLLFAYSLFPWMTSSISILQVRLYRCFYVFNYTDNFL